MLNRLRTKLSKAIAPKEETPPTPNDVPEWFVYMDEQPVIEI